MTWLARLQILENTPSEDWPDDTREVLLNVLSDAGATEEERQLAAELAGDTVVVDDELAEVLLAVLASAAESEAIRSQAAISLGPALEQCDLDGFDEPDTIIAEETFDEIRETMRTLYFDPGVPGEVRRRILEASVRAPLDWHAGAIRTAYESTDLDWVLSAVFCMRFVTGFEPEILASLSSPDLTIHVEAVLAAGAHGLEGAWLHVVDLVERTDTEKSLLLAAIQAVGEIRPAEAPEVLAGLEESEDPDIAETALEAMAMSEVEWDDEEDGPLH